jgi:NTP pyrophosphatase (non-canonical NTP hydrolase)
MIEKKLANLPDLVLMVSEENSRQLKKWGIQDRTPFEWLAFLTEEIGELSQAITENHFMNGKSSEVVKEAIQAATLVLKIAEMYSDSEW